MTAALLNANPIVHDVHRGELQLTFDYDDEESRDRFEASEVFEFLRNINDPEHPLTLEQLNVVSQDLITLDDENNFLEVQFTPTIPHCSMATLIGLCIRVKLLRSLPSRFKVTVKISPGGHQSEDSINKQLNDKERVAAALENAHLADLVNKCLSP